MASLQYHATCTVSIYLTVHLRFSPGFTITCNHPLLHICGYNSWQSSEIQIDAHYHGKESKIPNIVHARVRKNTTQPQFNHVQMTNVRRLTGTHYSCIISVGAGTPKVVGIAATLVEILLCPCTMHTVIPGWTTARSKGSTFRSFNCSWVAQLTTHDCSISKIPAVMADSSPVAKEKDLNTAF